MSNQIKNRVEYRIYLKGNMGGFHSVFSEVELGMKIKEHVIKKEEIEKIVKIEELSKEFDFNDNSLYLQLRLEEMCNENLIKEFKERE